MQNIESPGSVIQYVTAQSVVTKTSISLHVTSVMVIVGHILPTPTHEIGKVANIWLLKVLSFILTQTQKLEVYFKTHTQKLIF